jgi:transcriptional regulator with XRE-family HTH domain
MARSSSSSIEADPAALAARLKRLRVQRGWTLAELSNLTKLSKPYLSRLESAQRQPSLAALLALGRIFDTPIHSLLDSRAPQASSPIVIQSSRAGIQRSNGLRYRAVSGAGAMVNLSAVHVTVPRRRRQTGLARHEGEELLYVLSGSLNLVFEHELHTLQPGDSAHFDAQVPHRLAASGDSDVEVLVVACAPTRKPESFAAATGTRRAHRRSAHPAMAQAHNLSAPVPICASLAGG